MHRFFNAKPYELLARKTIKRKREQDAPTTLILRKGRASRLFVGMISRIEDVTIKEVLGLSADRDDPPYHKLSMIRTNPNLSNTHVSIQSFDAY